MRDFPVFTTEDGVGSLIFKEIPYQGAAFVKIHDVSSLEGFLAECISFSKVAGAERIYASGNADLSAYPVHTSVFRMRVSREDLPDTDACLMPLTQEHLEDFRQLYNRRMRDVPNHAFMTQKDAEEMLSEKEGYFVHRNGELLGIGIAGANTIKAVVSCIPGSGRDVVLALNYALNGEFAELDVASENKRAIRLYDRLGFIKVREISKWYKIY